MFICFEYENFKIKNLKYWYFLFFLVLFIFLWLYFGVDLKNFKGLKICKLVDYGFNNIKYFISIEN